MDLPVGEEIPDAAAASRSLEDAGEVVPLRDCKADGPGKKEGARIHEVEALAGLKPIKLPVEVVAVEHEIFTAQRDLPFGSLRQLLCRIPPHRQGCGEVHRSFRDLLCGKGLEV